MTPAQRIARVLHSRGREATPAEVSAWMDEYRTRTAATRVLVKPPRDDQIARAIERDMPGITMMLHLRFGDSLED